MDESTPPAADDVHALLERDEHGELALAVDRLRAATPEERKEAIRSLRAAVEADSAPGADSTVEAGSAVDLQGMAALEPFLDDDERAVRLTTAKLFVAVAEADPDAVAPAVESLAARLADEDEFYYVRARSAEALGYVALEHPEAVATPELLADLRVGLEFDEPEVAEKLAKTLAFVALGDPGRLRHQTGRLAEHLDDGGVLVRYHLTTALVAVGAVHPGSLADASEALVARLDDSNPYVRGRAAEALGLLAEEDDRDTENPGEDGDEDGGADVPAIPVTELADLADSDESFVADRARFAMDQHSLEDAPDQSTGGELPGTIDSVRRSTEAAVDELTSPDADGECPHCGLELPEQGPPMCPRCGAPR